jgi:cytochrome c peroxidase
MTTASARRRNKEVSMQKVSPRRGSSPISRFAFAAVTLAAPLTFTACDEGTVEDFQDSNAALTSLTGNFANGSGTHATVSTTGSIDANNAFFQSLGSNGRACVTCHDASTSWSITPASVQARFNASNGTDPIFRLNDGANAPNLPVATLAQRRTAYSMLLNHGVIRVGLPIPANAEFELVAADDPYFFASSQELSLFRRPLPTTNLRFLSGVMWDGRESVPGSPMAQNLARQANDATLGHAQATVPLTTAQQTSIVNFELALFTAQSSDSVAGSLSASPAKGGPTFLSQQSFFIGINDPLGGNPQGTPFTSKAFTLYDGWAASSGSTAAAKRASIARGQDIFNNHPIRIAGVAGLNDTLGVATVNGTCTTCHDSPNAGDHSVALPLDIGLTTPAMRMGDMPLYTLRNKTTGATVRTTDPGRAMITGKWADMSKFKGPILRGLSGRAPYFHNAVANTLTDVIKFYDTQFHIGLDATQFVDLANFLATL